MMLGVLLRFDRSFFILEELLTGGWVFFRVFYFEYVQQNEVRSLNKKTKLDIGVVSCGWPTFTPLVWYVTSDQIFLA